MLKNKKGIVIVISLIFLGIALILCSKLFEGNDEGEEKQFDHSNYENSLEEKIEEFLLKIQGINKATVIVTLDTSSEHIYAQSNENYVIIDKENGECPISVSEIYPRVRGIAIACTGGNSDEVKVKITRIIAAYLDIPTNRIEIVGIK